MNAARKCSSCAGTIAAAATRCEWCGTALGAPAGGRDAGGSAGGTAGAGADAERLDAMRRQLEALNAGLAQRRRGAGGCLFFLLLLAGLLVLSFFMLSPVRVERSGETERAGSPVERAPDASTPVERADGR